MSRFAFIAAAAVLTLGAPVLAADRSPAQRQGLIDLAYVLGQSHGLRQVCHGAEDQAWRVQMTSLLKAEAPDDAFNRRLRESFNTGFTAAQARFPECNLLSQNEAVRVAQRGRDLALAAAAP